MELNSPTEINGFIAGLHSTPQRVVKPWRPRIKFTADIINPVSTRKSVTEWSALNLKAEPKIKEIKGTNKSPHLPTTSTTKTTQLCLHPYVALFTPSFKPMTSSEHVLIDQVRDLVYIFDYHIWSANPRSPPIIIQRFRCNQKFRVKLG
jgi:hypothetical protein